MGLGQVRANVLCSVLPMTSAERETHLHFMEARSEVKRGKVTLPPHVHNWARGGVGFKLQTVVERAWKWAL